MIEQKSAENNDTNTHSHAVIDINEPLLNNSRYTEKKYETLSGQPEKLTPLDIKKRLLRWLEIDAKDESERIIERETDRTIERETVSPKLSISETTLNALFILSDLYIANYICFLQDGKIVLPALLPLGDPDDKQILTYANSSIQGSLLAALVFFFYAFYYYSTRNQTNPAFYCKKFKSEIEGRDNHNLMNTPHYSLTKMSLSLKVATLFLTSNLAIMYIITPFLCLDPSITGNNAPHETYNHSGSNNITTSCSPILITDARDDLSNFKRKLAKTYINFKYFLYVVIPLIHTSKAFPHCKKSNYRSYQVLFHKYFSKSVKSFPKHNYFRYPHAPLATSEYKKLIEKSFPHIDFSTALSRQSLNKYLQPNNLHKNRIVSVIFKQRSIRNESETRDPEDIEVSYATCIAEHNLHQWIHLLHLALHQWVNPVTLEVMRATEMLKLIKTSKYVNDYLNLYELFSGDSANPVEDETDKNLMLMPGLPVVYNSERLTRWILEKSTDPCNRQNVTLSQYHRYSYAYLKHLHTLIKKEKSLDESCIDKWKDFSAKICEKSKFCTMTDQSRKLIRELYTHKESFLLRANSHQEKHSHHTPSKKSEGMFSRLGKNTRSFFRKRFSEMLKKTTAVENPERNNDNHGSSMDT